MKYKNFLFIIHLCIFLSIGAGAQTIDFRNVTDGGSGMCKAYAVMDESLPGMTIFRPADLEDAFGKVGRLPVVVAGNGGCVNSPKGDETYYNEIASHGYIVIAIGPLETGMISHEREDPQGGTPGFMGTSPDQLIGAIDWVQKQDKRRTGEYFGKVDVDKIASLGSSCGGLQAIDIAYDTRVKTVIMKNSGTFPQAMPMGGSTFTKEDLSSIQVPVLYCCGNEQDVAYPNAKDDFEKLTSVPVAFCSNANFGHEGTSSDPHGGALAEITVKWLDYLFRGDESSKKFFMGGAPSEWTIMTKNMN